MKKTPGRLKQTSGYLKWRLVTIYQGYYSYELFLQEKHENYQKTKIPQTRLFIWKSALSKCILLLNHPKRFTLQLFVLSPL